MSPKRMLHLVWLAALPQIAKVTEPTYNLLDGALLDTLQH